MAKLIWEWKSWYIWEDADRGHLPIFERKCLVIQIITMSQHIKKNLRLPKVYWAFFKKKKNPLLSENLLVWSKISSNCVVSIEPLLILQNIYWNIGFLFVSEQASAHLGCVVELGDMTSPLVPCPAGILDQSAVWVDEMNYYDMRTDRNKGISPLSLRPSNPLGIEIDKYGLKTYEDTHSENRTITQP